jgi:hypothetical protein
MARIRTIKPEFWDSPDTARASLRARLLYIAMWNLADDYGVGDGNHRRIIGFAFPNDEIGVSEIPRLISEVSRTFSVMFYEHEGRPYYYIPSWENHQRTEKRAKQRVPFPDLSKTPETSWETGGGGISAESVGSSGAGTGEQGNRGTGELENKRPTPSDDFPEWWDAYPRKDSKIAAEKAYPKAWKTAGAQALLEGAIRYRDDPNRKPSYTKLPATWLNAGSWNDSPLPGPDTSVQRMDRSAMLRAKEADMLSRFIAAQEQQPFLQIED